MRLTRSTDAAIRILVLLSRGEKRLSARDISQNLDVPFNHTAKILQNLAKTGFIRTVKGRGGGVELARSPESITLDQVITSNEGPIHLMECTINRNACSLAKDCRLSRTFKEAQDSMIRIFRNTSIADLIADVAPTRNRRQALRGPRSQ